MAYKPGSFSKNFAWHGTGLQRLYRAIRVGFAGQPAPVERNQWRTQSGIDDEGLELIPPNFFLHNIVVREENIVPVDELVLHALTHPHTVAFDRLALFALNLSRGGARHGSNSGEARPALWANEFIRDLLWSDGGWHRAALDVTTMDQFFDGRIDATGPVRRKVRSNYRHLYELCDYIPSSTEVINSGALQWGVAAHFLNWDRMILDGDLSQAAAVDALVNAAQNADLHKLLGLPAADSRALASDAAELYVDVGHTARLAAAPAVLASVEQGETDVAVSRQIRAFAQQIRDTKASRELKRLYRNTCMFCSVALQVAKSPDQFFSNAAHIKPLGKPHDGPDRPSNMLVLCPNHHVQFDAGILRVEAQHGKFLITSKLPNDPLHGNRLRVEPGHDIDPAMVQWHFDFHSSPTRR